MRAIQKAKCRMQKASRWGIVTVACLLLCLGATPKPPAPKVQLLSPKAAGVQASAPMAKTAAVVAVPPKQIKLWWSYPVALSPDLTFNIYRTADLRQPFRHVADVDAPPAVFPVDAGAGYFLCRTSNRITHEVSGWNVKGKL